MRPSHTNTQRPTLMNICCLFRSALSLQKPTIPPSSVHICINRIDGCVDTILLQENFSFTYPVTSDNTLTARICSPTLAAFSLMILQGYVKCQSQDFMQCDRFTHRLVVALVNALAKSFTRRLGTFRPAYAHLSECFAQ